MKFKQSKSAVDTFFLKYNFKNIYDAFYYPRLFVSWNILKFILLPSFIYTYSYIPHVPQSSHRT